MRRANQERLNASIPSSGELIRGKADGKARSLTGPLQPVGRTFTWKQTSPLRIEFRARDNGHLVETAIETLAPDGNTFTDTFWEPGHEDEKRISIFIKK